MNTKSKSELLKVLDSRIVKKYGTQENLKSVIESSKYDKNIFKELVKIEKRRVK